MTGPIRAALRSVATTTGKAGKAGSTGRIRRLLLAAAVVVLTGSGAVAATSLKPSEPVPVITAGPADPTGVTGATFVFTAVAGVGGHACSLDTGPYVACTSPRTYPGPLAEGRHTFRVRGQDTSGRTGPAASWTWRVDLTPPRAPVLTATPANPTGQTAATFSFDGGESGARFSCRLDSAAFTACTSPKTYAGPLAEGSHTIAVRAVDAAGNIGPPTAYSWRIDTTPPPPPVIVSGPADPTTDTAAAFDFTDAEYGVAFRCRLDTAAFTACTGHRTYAGLSAGSHTFSVQAVDRAGNPSTAAVYAWTVQTPVRGFTLGGDLSQRLSPGLTAPLNVTITNPFHFDILVSRIAVTPRQSTSRAGQPNPACDGTVNLTVAQPYSGPSPLRVQARRTLSLSDLGVPPARWPLLRMPNLPVNQDACKNTAFTLTYSADARR